MALHPVFQRKPFRRTALTNSINTTFRLKREFDAMFQWRTDTSPVDKVQINIGNDNVMGIVPMTPRDGVPPVIGGDEREAVEIKIPSFAGRATIYNAEALGVIAGLEGDQVDENLQNLIDGRNEKILETLENTQEHARAGVFRNKAVDAKGATILDYKKSFGLEQGEFGFDLSGGKKFAPQLEKAKNEIRKILGDGVVTSFKLLVGQDTYFNLSENDEYRQADTAQNAIRLSQGDMTEGVRINKNVDIVPIWGPYWGATECKLVPMIQGGFRRLYGPSTATSFWGTVLPAYTTMEELPHEKGVEMETWSHVLHYFTRPDAIMDCEFAF